MNESPWTLPDSWRWARFDEVAHVASNLTDPARFPDLPHIAPNHIESGTGKLLPYATIRDDGVTSAKHKFCAGQILYSKIRPYLAKVVTVDFEGLCSADMYPIETELDATFLKWWMLTREFTRRAAGEQARTVLPKINVRSLSGLPVPVPPIEEQRRIVDILEDHLSRLDAANVSIHRGVKQLAGLRRSALNAITERYTAGHVSLSDLVRRIEAGKSFGSAARTSTDDEWGILKVSAMTWGEFRQEENKVVMDPSKVDPRYQVHAGDLLVSRANTSEYVGASVLVRDEPPKLLLSDKSLRVIPDDGVEPEFLWRVLSAPRARQQISDRASGNQDSMRNISQAALLAIQVPRLRPDQQKAVVAEANELDQATRRLSASLTSTLERSAALRRGLLKAAFVGRLTGVSGDTELIEEMAGV